MEQALAARAKFPGQKLGFVKLLKPGIIQYDRAYPDVVVSSAEVAVVVPLTPFFMGRLGDTLELVRIVE